MKQRAKERNVWCGGGTTGRERKTWKTNTDIDVMAIKLLYDW